MTTTDFIFGVDLDGVCGNYTRSLAEVVEADRRLAPGTLPEPDGWDFANWNFKEGDFTKYHTQLVVEKRGFLNMEPIEGASEALWNLSNEDIWIRIVTHRFVLPGNHGVIAADTVTWLDKVDIPYRDICFLSRKADVRADLYVDDAPHNIEALASAGAKVVIFDQPYNRQCTGDRVHSWSEMEEYALEAKAKWSASC